MKVLATELTGEQVKFLESEKARHYPLSFAPHALTKAVTRRVTMDDIVEAVYSGKLVEFNNDKGTRRTLWRSAKGIHVAIDIDTGYLITCFINAPNDNHKTLNRSKYHWGNVSNEILGLISEQLVCQ